jgi:hypothetical protein
MKSNHLEAARPTPNAEIEVTPKMIDEGVKAVWPDPKPPEFVRETVTRIFLAMFRAR